MYSPNRFTTTGLLTFSRGVMSPTAGSFTVAPASTYWVPASTCTVLSPMSWIVGAVVSLITTVRMAGSDTLPLRSCAV